jgi:PAS domain S-box-containing protein
LITDPHVNRLLNAQSNFTIITNGVHLIKANKFMLQFFGFETLEDFQNKYECICDFFINEEDYLQKEYDGKNWVQHLLDFPDKVHYAKIIDLEKKPHIFHTKLSTINPENFLIVFTDVTHEIQYKQTLEKKLLEKTAELKQSAKTISKYVLYTRTDPHGIITEVSDAYCQLTGYTQNELIGKDHSVLRHPDVPDTLYKQMWETLLQGKSWQGEMQNLAKDGSNYWVDSTISPEYNAKGKLKGYISTRYDITAKKKFEKQHMIMLEQAKMASLGEMIGNIAHQWRQPLNAISVCASTLRMKKSLGTLKESFFSESLLSIEKSAQYLSDVIDTFRDYIKGSKVIKTICVQEELQKAIALVKDALHNSYITLDDRKVQKGPIYLKSKGTELIEIIVNILNNAKDALVERKTPKGAVTITLSSTHSEAVITIQDNAGGIPEDIITKIFEPYFTTKHKSQGTGLGLYMSYSMVTKNFKGDLTVTNTKEGALFTITLPLEETTKD